MRIDHDSHFPCPLTRDPFATLVARNKTYGWLLAAPEGLETIATLWPHVRRWLITSRWQPAASNALRFVSNDSGRSLDPQLCHFYNNFEMAAFSLFRSASYLSFFNYLDRKGALSYYFVFSRRVDPYSPKWTENGLVD
jgi:alpha 1,2-mannosyltransferase